jgi:hypothetical protein
MHKCTCESVVISSHCVEDIGHEIDNMTYCLSFKNKADQ